jgi:hypothetical protein
MNCIVCANEIHHVFYTTVDNKGNIDTYCFGCYSVAILDNHEGMVDGGGTNFGGTCECGKEKHGFASHSNWCDMAGKGLG